MPATATPSVPQIPLNVGGISLPVSAAGGGPITIQLPTQPTPQPLTPGSKVTYQLSPTKTAAGPGGLTPTAGQLQIQPAQLQAAAMPANIVSTSTFQPVKLTTTGFAYTATGMSTPL